MAGYVLVARSAHCDSRKRLQQAGRSLLGSRGAPGADQDALTGLGEPQRQAPAFGPGAANEAQRSLGAPGSAGTH